MPIIFIWVNLTVPYWNLLFFFRWNINIDKYMYINGQKWKRVSQKRIRKQSKWIKTVWNATDKQKFFLSKNYAFRINWWGWSLGNKPFHPLNFRLSNIIHIKLFPRATNIFFSRFQVYAPTNLTWCACSPLRISKWRTSQRGK